MFIRDLNGDEYPLMATVTLNDASNGESTLSADINHNKVNTQFLEKLDRLWEIYIDDVGYKITNLSRRGSGNKLKVSLNATFLFKDYMDTNSIMDSNGDHYRYDGSLTAFNAFTKIFEGTPFDFVILDNLLASSWENFGGGESKLETFNRALDHYKCEFRVEGNTIFLEKIVTRKTSKQFRHGFNSSNIVQEIDANSCYTAIRGYGNYGDGEGGEDYRNAKLKRDYVSPLAKILGKRYAPPFTNGNVKIVAEMDRNLKEIVDESLKVSISADYHQLKEQGFPIGKTKAGDSVFVIDDRIKFDEEVRIAEQEITYAWNYKITNASYTFGNEGLGKRHNSMINSAAKNITDIFEGRKELPLSALDKRVQEISKIINGNTDSIFKYMSNGVIGWNGDDSNYMTRYVGDAIGFSKDGGVTYGTAMSAKLGIVADYITTGTLRAIIVDGVEIYGSRFESQGLDDDYTIIEGGNVSAGGKYTRTWFGKTTNHDVNFKFTNGLMRVEDAIKDRRLWYSDTGISTFKEGYDDTGNDDTEYYGSGVIDFYSNVFNKDVYGLTLFSNRGVLGLKTMVRDVVLDAGGSVQIPNDNLRSNALISRTGSKNLYLGVSGEEDGELRVTNKLLYNNGDIKYKDVRARHYRGNSFRVNDSGANLYLGTSTGEVRVTTNELSLGGYRPIRARDFITDTSLPENKKNIEEYTADALSVVKKANVYLYNRLDDETDTKKQLGLMLPELPSETYSEQGDSFAMYSLISFTMKGLMQYIEQTDKRLELLEGA